MRPKITDAARGKWPSLLPMLGVDKRFLTNKHGPCPMCEGRDRFRFDDKDGRGSWICSQCGAGNGVDLVMRINALEFRQAAQEIEKHLGTARTFEIRKGPAPEKVKAEMASIWRGSVPLDELGPTLSWWRRRIGQTPGCADLRAHAALACGTEGVFPAMVAKVRDAAGNWINLHRTFLDRNGDKAPIDDPRRVMPLQLPRGSAVRLGEAGAVLGIAEGIETACAATALYELPCWAALNANNMEGWLPPDGVLTVVIFGDNDASATGQAAAWTLARKLRARKITATVEMPEREGEDWNDVLLSRRERVA